jgi:glucose-1-phosphate adenylyltransferase
MARPDVLVFVLAGGAGGRLELLTEQRAKPAVPFAGQYRLIDFPLSNCLHSAISDVWVLQQYQPASLNDHLANGRPWDLDRTTGGLLVLPPHEGTRREGFTQGTADGLWRNASLIRELAPRHLIVVSADAVYRLNYRDVLAVHRDAGAALTMVTTRVDRSEAGRYGVVQVDGDRVVDYAYKPDEPASDTITTEVFVMEPDAALDTLEQLAGEMGEDSLEDLGTHLLPRLVEHETVRQFQQPGYWRDVGTIDAYWSAHMDFLADDPPIDLDDLDWPIRTQGGFRSPAWVAEAGSARRSLLAAATSVAGEVVHSVLAPGVRVEAAARVEDSVLLPGAVVRAGARVARAVVDDRVEIGRDAEVGGAGDITLLGGATTIADGERVEPGERRPRP